ncbi:MAG: CpsB/CapC family capsule biosynthesis tyrosine phosphatase [Ginsengibacter sp.]
MFSFLKKQSPSQSRFQNLKRDIHSHILPGIDDGSPDVETSLTLVRGLIDLGITETVATPHIIGDLYRNNKESINQALQKLSAACEEFELQIKITAAAEYMLDDYFMDLLRKKEGLLTIAKNYILTELTYTTMPESLEDMSFEINTSGYQPIMAHPERYLFYHKNYDQFYRLKELGFLLQVNLLSVTGYYGPGVAKAAKFILEKGLADYVGTDMHHQRHLNMLSNKNTLSIIHKLLGDKMYNDFDVA